MGYFRPSHFSFISKNCYPAGYLKNKFNSFARKLKNISCKTLYRKNVFTYFGQFVDVQGCLRKNILVSNSI